MVPLLIVASPSQDEDLGLCKTGKRVKKKKVRQWGWGTLSQVVGEQVKRRRLQQNFRNCPGFWKGNTLLTSFPQSAAFSGGTQCCPPPPTLREEVRENRKSKEKKNQVGVPVVVQWKQSN